MTEELKPCPFCGCEEVEYCNTNEFSYWFRCVDCGTDSGTYNTNSKEEAVAFWNTRTPQLPSDWEGMREALEGLLFWLAQGNFSSLPMKAIEDMQTTKKRAQAALAVVRKELNL